MGNMLTDGSGANQKQILALVAKLSVPENYEAVLKSMLQSINDRYSGMIQINGVEQP